MLTSREFEFVLQRYLVSIPVKPACSFIYLFISLFLFFYFLFFCLQLLKFCYISEYHLDSLIHFVLMILDVSPPKSFHREHSSIDKRDGNHTESRNSSGDQRKDMQRLSEVVKTCSVHTTALPTVVYR